MNEINCFIINPALIIRRNDDYDMNVRINGASVL